METRLLWALIALAFLSVCEGRDVRRAKRQLSNEDDYDSDPTEREAKKLLVDGFIVSNKKRVSGAAEIIDTTTRWLGTTKVDEWLGVQHRTRTGY